MTEVRQLTARPLTATAFRPYGDVIETAGTAPKIINQGFAQRFNDLCAVEAGDGSLNVSLFTANPRPLPIAIKMMERHPLGSQAFVPMQDQTWLVLVCDEPRNLATYHLFAASGRQGVNYSRNVWHHPLLVFETGSHFLIVDRKGPGDNLEEVWLPEDWQITISG